jgi:predicted O-linked N-acetylglucosamine transferase (SPINDLY family)
MLERRYLEALVRFQKSDLLMPDQPQVLQLLAACLRETGHLPEAVGACEHALVFAPGDPWFRNCIGVCLIRMGHFGDGLRRISQVAETLPPDRETIMQFGIECQEQGSPHGALEYFSRAYNLFPNDIDTCVNLGITVQALGNAGEALFYFKRATEIQPKAADAWCYAGGIYESVRDIAHAIECYEKALEQNENHAEALARLASRRKEQGRPDEAKVLLRKAIKSNPDWLTPYLNLISFLKDAKDFDEAEDVLAEAEKRWPHAQEVRHTRADLFLKRADIDGAMKVFREILAEQPRNPDAMSGMLFCMNYDPSLSPEALAAAYKDWDTRFNAQYRNREVAFLNDRDTERKLRVGYVSGDFRGHSVGFFAEPVLGAHDHDKISLYCYANLGHVDDVTQKFMRYADHWRWIQNLSDEAVLELIRLDEIDILIDLSNHTAYHRLYMFARRAAPIQMTWIGMPTTTGLSAIDYRISDALMDPPGMTEALHSEKLLRLTSGWCYRPSKEGENVAVRDAPVLRNNYVTFASFNAFGKINKTVIRNWARIFKQLPDAILYMASGTSDTDTKANDKIRSVFKECGFPIERLRPFGSKPLGEYFEFHNSVDIVLDPYPYNGGTVTAHALWMSTPVVTFAGRKSIQRMGASMLGSVGCSDLVAGSEKDYVRVAVDLARNVPRLVALKRELRGRMLKSPLMDAKLAASDLETEMQRVWTEWCAQQEIEEKQKVVAAVA